MLKKRGMPKGRSGNPAGKPKGAKNKVSLSVKSRIADFVENSFDSYVKDLEALPEKERVRAFTELIKLIVPRPVSEEELDAVRGHSSSVIARLFMSEMKD